MRASSASRRGGPRWSRFGTSRALCCICLLAASPGVAQPVRSSEAPTVELSWSGPGPELQCLGAAALQREVNQYLGREVLSDSSGELALHVEVEARPRRTWRALLRLRDEREGVALGERELLAEGPLCSSLNEALILSVALLVDADLAPSPASTQPSVRHEQSQPAPDEEALPNHEPTGIREFDQPPPHHARMALEAGLVASYSALPELALGAELGAQWLPLSWLGLRARVLAFAPQTSQVAESNQIKTRLWYAGGALCPRALLSDGVRLLGCVGMDGGSLTLRTEGLEAGVNTTRRVWFGSLALRLDWELGARWSFISQVGLSWPLRRQRFWYQASGQRHDFYEMDGSSAALGAGVALWFE